MKLFILPDPDTLPCATHDVPIEELDDHYWWVGTVTSCCYWDRGEDPELGEEPFGFLEVAVSFPAAQV